MKLGEVLSHDIKIISTLTQVPTVMQHSVMYMFSIQLFALLIKYEINSFYMMA